MRIVIKTRINLVWRILSYYLVKELYVFSIKSEFHEEFDYELNISDHFKILSHSGIFKEYAIDHGVKRLMVSIWITDNDLFSHFLPGNKFTDVSYLSYQADEDVFVTKAFSGDFNEAIREIAKEFIKKRKEDIAAKRR